MGEKSVGNLVIIGGNEDKEEDCLILKKIVDLAGGKDSEIAVIPTATLYPQEAGLQYQDIFYDLGASKVEVLDIQTREHANSPDISEKLNKFTGVFFTGGDQLRITSILGGTKFDGVLHECYRSGTVIAGTSAGAAAITDTMIVEGIDETSPAKNSVALSHGLGFLKEAAIDQHFAQRGRIGRLLSAVAQNPFIIGLGIDEDTAVVVNDKSQMSVEGSGTVTVIDGQTIANTNVSEEADNQPLALTNLTLHVLPANYSFDLYHRKSLLNKEEG
ncbi:cyanophycinase [Natranaerobius trueperi]|uniref:Cyanophycinase n=1 Tax=Natranaerobius trueperi TaxID=759412 RepID=A0A226BXJ9_9FIRM|nr:cyanophycinase [Natranaerobius trueperi]OWZ83655.1 cyanophycinase [Natranaerobius trueperi]